MAKPNISRLSDKHIEVIKEFVATNLQGASYAKFFGTGNANNDKANASNFFKRADVKQMVKLMQEERGKALVKATEIVYQKMYAEQIATLAELDIFHTKVIRGEITVQETFAVKEKIVVEKRHKGKLIPMIEERVVFKKVDRNANLLEKQRSASELYRRNGAYMNIKRTTGDDQDDTEAAETAKNTNVETIERVVVLSNGTKLPMNLP